MYQAGDLVIYGTTGPCKVQKVAARTLPGGEVAELYYTLEPLYQRQCTIYTPVENRKVAMRPVISKAEAERLISLIPSLQPEPYNTRTNSQLTEHYIATIKRQNCTDLLALTMSIYSKKQELEGSKRKFGVVDERFLRQAEDLLFSELAVALNVPKEDVPAYIAARVEAAEDTGGTAK